MCPARLIGDVDPDKPRKAVAAMMRMKEPDIEVLHRAGGRIGLRKPAVQVKV